MLLEHGKSFSRDQRGGIAILFAIGLVPLLTGIGVAIDYSVASNARATLTAAADSAVLAAAKTRGTPAQREKAARDVLDTNLAKSSMAGTVTPKFVNLTAGSNNTGYRIELEAEVKSMFGGLTKSRTQRLSAAAEASSGSDDPIEIAFVLDTTDSMAGDRIVSLKRATTDIVEEITKRTQRPDLVKVGVVPFSQYVNVGLGRRAETWLDVAPDYQTNTYDHCWNHRDKVGENNCRMVHTPARPAVPPHTCIRDGRERQCGGSAAQPARNDRVCDSIYGPPRRVCEKRGGNWVRWNGCVGSRNYPLNTVDGQYDTKIPGILGISCGTPLLDLTTSLGTVKSTINSLNTNGETYLPSGLIWGWRMLSSGVPLAAGAPASANPNKFMILVTDGRNTKSPNYPRHDNSDGAESDRLTREICRNVAKDTVSAVKVFTIAFAMDGLDAKAILQECAAMTGGQFYDATDAGKLKEAFGQVFDKIFTLKLTY